MRLSWADGTGVCRSYLVIEEFGGIAPGPQRRKRSNRAQKPEITVPGPMISLSIPSTRSSYPEQTLVAVGMKVP